LVCNEKKCKFRRIFINHLIYRIMETSAILLQLLTGGLLGVVGQLIRFLVGYKKLNDEALKEGRSVSNLFQTSRFVISLIIGFVAGIIGIVSLSEFKESLFLEKVKETILTLIGIGYAGTDFIEGFIKKSIPDTTMSSSQTNMANDGNAPTPRLKRH